jgi:choline dehydrogenase-like flavoprotein
MSHEWDAIIVGSGAGGGTAAHVLTKRGWNVLVLERGRPKTSEDFLPFDELHFWAHKSLIPKVTDDPMVYIDPTGKRVMSERWWEVNAVGGSTMIWDANFPRYTDEDFAVTQYLKDVPNSESMVDWPWTYDEFIPYFEKAEWDWCVTGDAQRSEERMRPGYQYPMLPLKPHASSEFLFSVFTPAKLKPYFGARAINSQDYGGRPACPFCGFCQLFGCAVNCRSNSVNTVLARARATGRCEVRPGHYVKRIEFDSPKNNQSGRVRGVVYVTEPGSAEKFLPSPRVFVSIQTIQSARLFLLSEIPDPNKMVGRFLTYHTKGEAHFTFKSKPVWDAGAAYQPRTAIGSLQLRGLYTYKDRGGVLRKGGKFSVYDPFTCITPIHLIKSASLGRTQPNVWGRDLVQYLHELRSQGGVSVSFTGDALSKYENYVDLDDQVKDPWEIPVARTHYRHDRWDQDLSHFALDRVADAVSMAGGELRRYEPQGEANPGYGHVHGALRAGKDPGKSVLDENCQSHTIKGLYVLDAAFMPTAGASNPSLTLIANAYRVCENAP